MLRLKNDCIEVDPFHEFLPCDVPEELEYNELGEIVGAKRHPVVIEPHRDGLAAGRVSVIEVAGTLSTPDGIAEVAAALAGSNNIKTSGQSNIFGDDCSALTKAAEITNLVINGALDGAQVSI